MLFIGLFLFLFAFIGAGLHHVHTRRFLPTLEGIKSLWADKWWLARCIFAASFPALLVSAGLSHLHYTSEEASNMCKAKPGYDMRVVDGYGQCVNVELFLQGRKLIQESKL